MKKRIRIQGLAILAALVVLAVFGRYILADSRSIISCILGFLLLLLGYFLRIGARGLKSELNPDGNTLIVSGIYALTRNPMYLGTLLIGTGIVTALFHWWVMAIFVTVYLSIYIPQMNKEAQLLRLRFGKIFESYCRSTPIFLPSLKSIFKSSPPGYLKIKSCWIKKELISLVLTSVLILGIILWRILIGR
ncbi:MAG: isoprenylcysteine carboxylmethyltransferase family protein [Candidatus Omnitrophica bacterium]|nr:isoprenylcysteine carboxylmethyltransferase family protein [Candidatus Omnitrophota bacterium]